MEIIKVIGNKVVFSVLFFLLLFSSCNKDNIYSYGNKDKQIVFKLHVSDYNNDVSSRSNGSCDNFDKVFHYIVNEDGFIVSGIKSFYNSETGEIIAEGLHEGNYRLLVLSVIGDYREDGVIINNILKESDEWLVFPKKIEKSLSAEYFHSVTQFKVDKHPGTNGEEETIVMTDDISMKRLIGRIDCEFVYNNNTSVNFYR